MKLRIQDNSLRLRLNQKEVALLGEQGSVESAIQFPGDQTLRYSVHAQPDADKVGVRYDNNRISVRLPTDTVTEWAKNNGTTIEGYDAGVHILVEKDFRCLHRTDGSEPDAYPNPLA
jgi:hypothetical protein